MRIKLRKISTKSSVKKGAALLISPLFFIYSFSAYSDCHGQVCESSPVSDCHEHKVKLKQQKPIKIAHNHTMGAHQHNHSNRENPPSKIELKKEDKPKVNKNTKACGCDHHPTSAITQSQSLEKDTKPSKASGISFGNWSNLSTIPAYRLLKIPISSGRSSPIFIFQEKILI